MSRLPDNWVYVSIGSLCNPVNGRAFKPSDWTNKGLPIVRIQNLNNPSAPYNYFDGEVEDKFLLRGGELLFAWSGTPGTSFGAHIWHGGEAILNQHIFRLEFDETFIDKHFFRYAINQKLNELINVAHGGAGLRHVTKGEFERTTIAFPPLNEQRRIAKKLDALLTRVNLCQSRLKRVPKIIDRYRRSVVVSATKGTLSEEWRISHEITKETWQATRLEKICVDDRAITYGVIKLGEDEPDGIPCLRTSNVRWLAIDENGIKRIKPEISNAYSRTILLGNEVLVNVRGTLGGISSVKRHMIGWNVSREVAVVPVNTKYALPKFVSLWIASNSSQSWLARKQKGIAYVGINIEDLRRLPVRLPSRKEQSEIIRRVEKLFTYSKRLDDRYVAAIKKVEQLTPSLLSKAFRGELVEQDPNDEPAEKLVMRISEVRANKPKETMLSSRRKTMKKPKAPKKDKIISVVEALKSARKELSSEQLFIAAGYPSDAEAEIVEQFFVDIRDALIGEQIIKIRRNNLDWFSLVRK